MNQLIGTFVGTLPLIGVIIWNILEVKSLRNELNQFRSETRTELNGIKGEITNIRERLATLEERDRLTHPILRGE